MTLPTKTPHSSVGFSEPTKSHRYRCRPIWLRLIQLVLFGAGILQVTIYLTADATRFAAPLSTLPPPKSSGATSLADTLPDLNWTACPSERETQPERHFRLWDEKLAQALRLSTQGLPRTENESWYAVTKHIHVFSAFFAANEANTITVTSLVQSHEPRVNGTPIRHPPLVCIIRTSNRTIQRKAHIIIAWTFETPSFKNALILCPSPNGTDPANHYVRVAVAPQYATTSSLPWLHVHHPPKKSKGKCCAVCVRPVFGALSLWKVVEFIAHYRVVGVRTFYFYDLNMTSDLKLLIARMQHLGVDLTLVPFKLLMNTTVEHEHVQAHGQIPSLYDCMFRSLSKMEYIVHVDIDELIVPLPNFSIPAIVQEAERKMKRPLGSLVVPMRYHCLEYPTNMRYSSDELLPLQTRLFTYYSFEVDHGGYTKYIARSRLVREAGVHRIYKYFGNAADAWPGRYKAYMRHYRQCCSYAPSNWHSSVGLFWNVTRVKSDTSFAKLSKRIERDPVVGALMSQMALNA